VIVAGVAVTVLLLSSGGNYKTSFLFQNAAQLVKGNLVQVSGTPVGKVQNITLTDNGQAKVQVSINDDYAPLRAGTQATVRASSLSGIANRYIDLRLPPATNPTKPSGSTFGQGSTTTAVDLDEIFNVFGPKQRAALRGVIRGFAGTYAGRGAQANAGIAYLNPSLAATSRLFRELSFDEPATRSFVRESARLVTDVDQRSADLAGLVSNLATTTGAIGRQRGPLADAISQLPDFMRRADTTFVNLRAALDDLKPLVDESKPVAKKLRPFLAELRPLARDARPTVHDLANLVLKRGKDNDLIDITRSNVPVRNIAIGPVQANGKQREGAFPASVKALAGGTPELGYAGPYAPDLTAWFDDFSNSGFYDANGATGRVAVTANVFSVLNGLPTNLVLGNLLGSQQAFGTAQTGQDNRCPGSSERPAPDGSNPYVPAGFNCDQSQVPLGP
jgi:phospholipid/cholesterol/gamma-HCH transport system substrate-binding protein